MKKVAVDIIDLESGRAKVVIGGDLTIKNCSVIRNKLAEVNAKYISVELEVAEVTGLDLSGIQVLYSFKNSMINDQRSVNFKVELSPKLSATIEKCGLTYFKN